MAALLVLEAVLRLSLHAVESPHRKLALDRFAVEKWLACVSLLGVVRHYFGLLRLADGLFAGFVVGEGSLRFHLPNSQAAMIRAPST